MADTRTCPYCAEVIHAQAIKCKFCGAMISGAASQAAGGTSTCSNCGALRPAGVAACPMCGEAAGVAGRPFAQPAPSYAPPLNKPKGDTVLVLGLISLIGGFFCGLLFFVGPFAWAAGTKYERECRALGFEPESNGRTGKILGMIATVLIGVGLLLLGVLLLIGVVGSASR
jgi:RNA polymerase subunit RPABC4/transcription elongation factor Spt4